MLCNAICTWNTGKCSTGVTVAPLESGNLSNGLSHVLMYITICLSTAQAYHQKAQANNAQVKSPSHVGWLELSTLLSCLKSFTESWWELEMMPLISCIYDVLWNLIFPQRQRPPLCCHGSHSSVLAGKHFTNEKELHKTIPLGTFSKSGIYCSDWRWFNHDIIPWIIW